MDIINVDVAVIGTGSAGLNAYRAAKSHTDSVVAIQHGPYGTTCARVGCMPSKLLIAAAESAHTVSESNKFGIDVDGFSVNGTNVMTRVRSERDRFVNGVIKGSIEVIPETDKILGFAKFIDNNTLQIDDRTTIKAKSIVIATGSTPVVLPMFSGAEDKVIINDDIFDWTDLPESVAIFGPGVIGLELGQALHRLGVKIRLFGKGGLLGPISDPNIREAAQKIFSDEFYLDTDAEIKSISKKDNKVIVEYINLSGEETTEEFDYLFAATGRKPNIDNIGLENTSLELDTKGVPLFNKYTMQCGDSSIFIAGDANNDLPLLHEASDEGKIAGDNAAKFPEVINGLRRSMLAVVFSDPQIAMVGKTYNELKDCCFGIGEADFSTQGRSRVMLKNKGKIRVYGEYGTGLFLGAEMIIPAAEHISHLLAWCHQQRMTIKQMLDMPFYHPVIEEGLRAALQSLCKDLKQNRGKANCAECYPGE